MSSIPVVTPGDLPAMRRGARVRSQRWIRSLAFAGLCAYGVDRWSRLWHHPPLWRLYGVAGLAVALVVLVPFVRRVVSRRGGPWGPAAAAVLGAGLILAALPVAGLPGEWLLHVRIAVSLREIGRGLSGLDTMLVPYRGHDGPIRLVMTLGAAVLLLDAAAALTFIGRPDVELGDGRRVAAALPLVALAIVPSTLVPGHAPVLQGLILFGLLALFVWGERIGSGRRGGALGLACVGALAGVTAAPALSSSRPWVNYEAWGAAGVVPGLESFNWNQTYGPLSWPQHGRVMFTVRARVGDYWKAEDLTTFNGIAWVEGPPVIGSNQTGLLSESDTTAPAANRSAPSPSPAIARRYTHTVQVTIGSMSTTDVIGGSGVMLRPQIAGGVTQGSAVGTWTAFRPLGPGDTYSATTYSPTPSASELTRASEQPYPGGALGGNLSLTLPQGHSRSTELSFPGFHRPLGRLRKLALRASPYAPAVTLARRLAARAATPYAFVRAVQSYLDDGNYIYDQRPQTSRYPLIDFLFHSRIGYCQQFSGAMAMLLRMGGVPARVAAGFTPGSFDPGHHLWTVSDTDAHAWVEAWFPEFGWVRFDPTPATAPALRNSALSNEPRPGAISRAFGQGHVSRPRTRRRTATASHTRTTPPAAAGGGSRPRGSGASGAGGWVAGGLALALLLAAGLWQAARRVPVDRLGELERALSRTGRPLRRGATLASLETRFHDSPDAVAYVRALRLERYGTGAAAPTAAGRRAVRAQLAAGLGLAGRLRALWALPPRP